MQESEKTREMRRSLPKPFASVANGNSTAQMDGTSFRTCKIVAVGKRRDGGTRYWCLEHKADATAKYGKPSVACRAAHIPPIACEDIFVLDLQKYKGGIALWGAVPAVYDTTKLPMDRGIHVHARVRKHAKKEMDRTFRTVRLLDSRVCDGGVLVTEIDAIYYMVTSVFGFATQHVRCSYCEAPHLDRDWFSVRPHRRHLCASCGKHFTENTACIGNPIVGVRESFNITDHQAVKSKQTLRIKQADFSGGIQLWGSNPAFIWTSSQAEEEGIHVHAFRKECEVPDLDETYGKVSIDGVALEPNMVRILMAQSAMPSIRDRVKSFECPHCHTSRFSLESAGFIPVAKHSCSHCGLEFAPRGRLRKQIGNPLPAILEKLSKDAVRKPQHHVLDLLSETL